ncbi:MAG: PqqD family protein, partial [Candidatus Binataceae bacterium]
RRGAADLDSIYTFNESGTKLWGVIEAGGSVAELAVFLQAEYGITAEHASGDAEVFLSDLTGEGLVEPA